MISGTRARRLLKVVMSIGLLMLLVYMIDWDGARMELAGIPSELAVAAVAIFALQFVISAWKWRASLLAHGVLIPFRYLLRTYCVGAYFSSFLPSSVGGDIYRTVRTSSYCSVPLAMFSVLLERVLGLIALVLVGAVGFLWLLQLRDWLSVGGFVSLVALMLAAYFAAPFVFLNGLRRTSAWQRFLPARLKKAVSGVETLSSNRFRLIELLGVCLLFQIVATFAIMLLFVAVGAAWLPAESAVANAAGSMAAILPVSINGIGVTEASFAGVASRLGVDFTTAAIVSLLVRILVLPMVLAFGVMYMFEDRVGPVDDTGKGVKTGTA